MQIILGAAELPDLTPPYFLAIDRQNADFWRETLRDQYPSRLLIPFAMRGDWNDTLACFDGADHSGDPNVFHVHAFTELGWEHRGDWGSFDSWLKQAEIDSAGKKKGDNSHLHAPGAVE